MARFTAFIFIAAVLAGCCACKTSLENDNTSIPAEKHSLLITIGSGGGFTGNINGVKIESDGTLASWSSMPTQDFKPDTVGVLPQEFIGTFVKIIEEDSLMTFDYKETGNFTSFLTITYNGATNRMRWSGLETDLNAVPPRLHQFIRALNDAYKALDAQKAEKK